LCVRNGSGGHLCRCRLSSSCGNECPCCPSICGTGSYKRRLWRHVHFETAVRASSAGARGTTLRIVRERRRHVTAVRAKQPRSGKTGRRGGVLPQGERNLRRSPPPLPLRAGAPVRSHWRASRIWSWRCVCGAVPPCVNFVVAAPREWTQKKDVLRRLNILRVGQNASHSMLRTSK
jgi:hypothetical protein